MAYNRNVLFLIVLEAEVHDQGSRWGTLSDLHTTVFPCTLKWWKGTAISFIKPLTPFLMALPLWSNHLPKVPLPNTITLGNSFNAWIWGEHKHAVYGTLQKGSGPVPISGRPSQVRLRSPEEEWIPPPHCPQTQDGNVSPFLGLQPSSLPYGFQTCQMPQLHESLP